MSLRKKSKVQRSLADFVPMEARVGSSRVISTQATLDTLKGVANHETVKAIAEKRGIDVNGVYKQIKWLRQNGYLTANNELTSKGLECSSGGLRTLQKLVRLHDLRFRVEIIKYLDRRFVSRRREYLELANIPSRLSSRRHWDGVKFALDSWRVEVTPKSFLLLAPDVMTDNSHETLLDLFLDVKKLVRKLERLFPVQVLGKGERLNVVVEGTHAALVGNVLAKKYNKEKRVFELRDSLGNVRLIIDNSLRLHELEAVSPVWAVDDESKVKRLLHEAVVQDISLKGLQEEIVMIKQVLQAQVEVQKLQTTSGLQVSKQVKTLRDYFGGEQE